MIESIRSFMQDRFAGTKERGASAVEYGLLIAGIAALIVVAVFALGPVVNEAFTDTCDTIETNGSPSMTETCGNDAGGGAEEDPEG